MLVIKISRNFTLREGYEGRAVEARRLVKKEGT